MNLQEYLKAIFLFEKFYVDELNVLCETAQVKEFEDNEMIFAEGSLPDEFYVVLEGKVSILKNVAGGRKRVLAVLEESKVFGEISLFDNEPRSAGAEASGDTKIVSFNIEKFRYILDTNSQLAAKFQRQIILILGSRIRKTNEKLNQGIIWGFTTQ
ncbi:MAG: cyclic nucleotide-binding domain-containing protein [Pseudomonadota bacterium]